MRKLHGSFTRISLARSALLSGATFLAMLGITGCSQSMRSTPSAQSASSNVFPQSTAQSSDQETDPTVLAATDNGTDAPSTINVFGELNGVEQSGSKPAGNGGFQQHTFIDEGYDSDVNLDPTGKWMVFTSTRHSEHPEIYLQRVDGMSVIQLTNDDADYAYPSFSADGKQIAFCSTRGGNWDIYVMDADGKNVVQITSGPQQNVHPSFSPDGTRLAYSSLGGKSDQWELWVADLTTGEKRQIGFGLFPTWCPIKTEDRIAFQRARQRGGRWFSLWTLDLVNGEARRVTEVAASSNAAIVAPTWSPDGEQLAFATIAEPADSTGDKPRGQQDIWTIRVDGTDRHRLTDGVGMNLCPSWSPDNRVYFVSDRSGAESIWSVNAQTVPGTKITQNASPDQSGTTGSTQEP